ncbi:MAG: nucleotidyltransferase domain-containing protein [Actinobacteria bacterium]|nr:nucleotidyltransferase domain-containing protein [Actinomycetota bacterium]
MGAGIDIDVGDLAFARRVAGALATVPGVLAVALGGSRAAGTHRPDSDWDFSLYYRGAFDPGDLRRLGWPGEIFPVGGWGGGVFNGGAWMRVDGTAVDVHYRDLDDVEFRLAEAREGRFAREPLAFHLAGVPTYIVVAELAENVVLHGDLPSPGGYPDALRRTAPRIWLADARRTLGYARAAHAPRGHLSDTAGAIALAFAQAAHAVLAARGEWITNEKTLIDRAGLRRGDPILEGLTADPGALAGAIDTASGLIEETAGPAADRSAGATDASA